MQVAVIGLGRLGSSFAASVATSGIRVRGVDIDGRVVDAIQDGTAPFDEPSLSEYVADAGEALTATTDATEAVPGCDVSFVFVNTYSHGVDGYSLDAVESAMAAIGKALPEEEDSHLVVLRSTVMPGDTTGPIVDCLERTSGRTVGEDLYLCYWPEMTALGAIIESMEDPEFRLVGANSLAGGDRLEAFIEAWRGGATTIVRTDITSAEIAKMGINTYVAAKMSFANNLGHICEGIGGDVDEVTAAMAHDSRISGKYFTAGVRYGGPCFPHDNVAFGALADRAGCTAPIASAADEINHIHTDWILEAVNAVTPSDGVVAVLGLTYKPGVSVVEESQGIALVKRCGAVRDVLAYDPIGISEAEATIGDIKKVSYTDQLEVAIDGADAAVLTHRDGVITEARHYHDIALVDPWRIFEPGELPDSVDYRPLGSPGFR